MKSSISRSAAWLYADAVFRAGNYIVDYTAPCMF